MRSEMILSTIWVLSFLLFAPKSHSQKGHWKFKEIIHGNYNGSTNIPDKLEIDVNEGVIEFSIRQKNDCTDRYRLTYKFSQDMHALALPMDHNSRSSYDYEFQIEPISSPCYDPEQRSFSNPSIRFTHWNSTSGLLGKLKNANSWAYKNHQQFIDKGSVDYYPHLTSVYKNAGQGTGEFVVTGPNQSDVDYYLKNYPGMVTDFRILFKGQSTAGKEEAFYYDILFVYELVKGDPQTTHDPCAIEAPDCSCCPGTIPIWNFETQKGDCICPEGLKWDKVANRCIK